MTTYVERFAALPEPIQDLLVRIADVAAGMSADEKAQAQVFLASVGLHAAQFAADDLVAAAELVTVAAQLVQACDRLSGDAASWLVSA